MKVEIEIKDIKIVPETDEERLIAIQHGGSSAPMHLWLKFPVGTPGLIGVDENVEAVWKDLRYHEAVFHAIAEGKDVMEVLQEVDKIIKAEEAEEKAEQEADEKAESLIKPFDNTPNIGFEYKTIRQEDGTYETIVYIIPLTTREFQEKVLTNPTLKELEVAIEEMTKEIAAKKAAVPPKKNGWFNW